MSRRRRTAAPARRLLFIGECRSLTAIRNGWSWEDGHLAAKPLFEALAAMGVDPAACEFCNLFYDPPLARGSRKPTTPEINLGIVNGLLALADSPKPEERPIVVALGKRVSKALAEHGVEHVALVHPAARGRIRKRERYIAHVATTLRAA